MVVYTNHILSLHSQHHVPIYPFPPVIVTMLLQILCTCIRYQGTWWCVQELWSQTSPSRSYYSVLTTENSLQVFRAACGLLRSGHFQSWLGVSASAFSKPAMSARLGEVPTFDNIHQVCCQAAQHSESEDHLLYRSSHRGPRNYLEMLDLCAAIFIERGCPSYWMNIIHLPHG